MYFCIIGREPPKPYNQMKWISVKSTVMHGRYLGIEVEINEQRKGKMLEHKGM